MLIAVISDTHLPRGARRLPDACVERIEAADLLLHAGDVATVEVLRELERIGPPLAAVHGNVDSAELRRLLPEERVVEAGGARIGMVHDAGPRQGRLERMRRRFGERAEAGGLRALASAAARARRGRLSDLQPRQPDRAAAGADAHDGHRAGRGAARSSFELIEL